MRLYVQALFWAFLRESLTPVRALGDAPEPLNDSRLIRIEGDR